MGGLIGELISVVRSYVGNRNAGPANTVFVEAKGLGGAGKNVEVYSAPGIFSRPPKGTRGVVVNLTRNYGVVVAMHNYQVVIDWTEDGETTIFSTTADGATVKARIDLKADGNIYLNGTSKYLVTWGALKAAIDTLTGLLAAHVHPSNGVVSPTLVGLTCDITAAKATTLRTDG